MVVDVLKFLGYILLFPLKLPVLLALQLYGYFCNPQKHDDSYLKSIPESKPPVEPLMYNHLLPKAGWPNHSASRTGELVDIGYLSRLSLREFVNPHTGEMTRGPWHIHPGNNVSGDMLCGWLLGYTSSHAIGKKPKDLLIKLADWMIEQKEGPTVRMDGGWRRNFGMVGAQSLLGLALYWTAWRETKNKKYLWRYVKLQLLGYGALAFISTAYLHFKPKWMLWLAGKLNAAIVWIAKKFKKEIKHGPIIIPYNVRSFYNDTNCMRLLAVIQRQTKGLHKWYYKRCAKNIWYGSKNWHLPFMDLWALGHVRQKTKDYVNFYTKYAGDAVKENGNSGELWYTEFEPRRIAKSPVKCPYFGESWDDERYDNSTKDSQTDGESIGPYFEWFYANRY